MKFILFLSFVLVCIVAVSNRRLKRSSWNIKYCLSGTREVECDAGVQNCYKIYRDKFNKAVSGGCDSNRICEVKSVPFDMCVDLKNGNKLCCCNKYSNCNTPDFGIDINRITSTVISTSHSPTKSTPSVSTTKESVTKQEEKTTSWWNKHWICVVVCGLTGCPTLAGVISYLCGYIKIIFKSCRSGVQDKSVQTEQSYVRELKEKEAENIRKEVQQKQMDKKRREREKFLENDSSDEEYFREKERHRTIDNYLDGIISYAEL